MKRLTAKDISLLGFLTALVMVSTMLIKIPLPATSGYIHPGDSAIFLASVIFGPVAGMIAGGIGSMLADVLSGYAVWALPTLAIKSIMGLLVGFIADNNTKLLSGRNILALAAGTVWMVTGYFAAGWVMTDSIWAALSSLPFNIMQGTGGIIIFIPFGLALKKGIHFFKSDS